MYGMGRIVSINVVKTIVQIMVAVKNDSKAGWIAANCSLGLNIGPMCMSSGQIPVGREMVAWRSTSPAGSASCTLSIDHPTPLSIHPLRFNQSLLGMISPVRLPDAWIE